MFLDSGVLLASFREKPQPAVCYGVGFAFKILSQLKAQASYALPLISTQSVNRSKFQVSRRVIVRIIDILFYLSSSVFR